MMYSVWNPRTRGYDYYVAAEANPTAHAKRPPKARSSSSMGATPEAAAWPVPPGARRAGSGVIPRGRVASLGAISDDVLLVGPWVAIAAILSVFVLSRK